MNKFQSTEAKNAEYISQSVTILGELLSRGNSLGTAYLADEIEAAPLAAILEVKVRFGANLFILIMIFFGFHVNFCSVFFPE